MKAIYKELVGYANGSLDDHIWRTVIVADETPASLTIDGADVDGLGDTDVIAAGSVLITPDANYIAFEDGAFTEKE